MRDQEEYKTEWNDKEYFFIVEYEKGNGYVYEDSLKIYLESDVKVDGKAVEIDVTDLIDLKLCQEVFEAMEDLERSRAADKTPFPGHEYD